MDHLEKYFGHGSLYRPVDALRDLSFLNWQRETPHYGQRQYEITVPDGVLKHLPDSPREEITPPTFVPIRLLYRPKNRSTLPVPKMWWEGLVRILRGQKDHP